MKPNPEMVILAREYRELTQSDLAAAAGITQPRVARIEAGTGADLSDAEMRAVADALGFPLGFFSLAEQRFSYGSSSVFTRSRQLKAGERRKISGLINVLRIHVKRMLDHVDVQQVRSLPRLSIDDYGTASACARALRVAWNLPSGPVRNLTRLLEGAGVVVIECDFGGVPMDATCIQFADLPPIVFIDKSVPGDRWRFTLAHELAHLVMHDLPHPSMEDEADDFASEFLVPGDEISPNLSRQNASKLATYMPLKEYWQVSIAMLVRKSLTLGKIDDNQRKWLIIQMNKLGIRKVEPLPIPKEQPSLFPSLIKHFREQLGFTDEELGAALMYAPDRLGELYGDIGQERVRPQLRIVR
ncbi:MULTISPECIES: ImmA/IrrE family metallo-endopeptidase [unclassified Stenotrophomonas]|uniref:ImmA/IrrE family metallo-endopeptidase n=1 Tax=unclassified Stenotrophomonas TaxID=196198 RepID=UPI0021177BE4|nr:MULTISPECIES: ImmA/IrrE family metallo-endopeptidase [unclassified Stenotrophomonas]